MCDATSVPPASQRGFSLLELTIVVGIVAALFAVALDRFLALRVQAERVSLMQMEGTLESALGIQLAAYIARGDMADVARMRGMNPMDLLMQPPSNYVGALDHPDPARIRGGHWYFDTRTRILVYRVRSSGYFHDALGKPARAEYRIQLLYSGAKKDGRYDPHRDELYGVRLVNLAPYQWSNSPPRSAWFLNW